MADATTTTAKRISYVLRLATGELAELDIEELGPDDEPGPDWHVVEMFGNRLAWRLVI